MTAKQECNPSCQSTINKRLPADPLFLQIIDQLPCRVLLKDTRSVFTACNRRFADDLSLSPAQVIGKCDADVFPAELAKRYRHDDLHVMRHGKMLQYEEPYLKHGENRWLCTTKFPLCDELGNVIGVGLFFMDTTEKKQQQEQLQRYVWTLEAIRRAHHAMLRQGDEQMLLQDICDAITCDDRFPLVTVLQAPSGQSALQVLAQAGNTEKLTNDSWLTRDPALLQAICDNQIHNDTLTTENNHYLGTLRARLLLPLPCYSALKTILLIHSEQASSFSQDEVALFSQLADYLSYGLQARSAQRACQAIQQDKMRYAQQLELALEDALGAIAALLEQRDPYTAGHQKNVATLATAIGRELALDGKQLRGLSLGAMVHDIGKIQIPVDILTKPGKLTTQEFNLVKEHPGAGYLVLKDIDFPWPIARMIHQHHEYLDGSGYPLGLKGDEILLEARILTVADIVESMSSDRPYRAALGIPLAREQIIQMRGHQLDADVVDACLRILDRGDFIPQPLGKP